MTSARSLLQRAREEGSPVVRGDRATFLWEGEAAPLLIGDPTGWDERPRSFRRLGAGPVWSCSLTVPADAYLEYAFLDRSSGEKLLDPLNPRATADGYGRRNNYFYMPGALPSPLAVRRAGVPAGTVTRQRVDAWPMQDAGGRDVYLYSPPAKGPVPLLVVYDGPDYLRRGRLTAIVENLIAGGRICPIAMAFLQNGRTRRGVEYLCSDATLSWLENEVLPLACKHLRLVNIREQPGAYGVLGASAGGAAAMYTGLRMADIFGRVLSQSGVFSFEGRDLASVDLVRHRHAHDLRIWMDIGTLDDLLEDNRRMARLLHEQGYDVTCREFSGGHNFTAWRDDVWRGLEALFPPGGPNSS